ncbi:MAG: hypothetical protein OXP07_03915 [Defluviicoccus sp.]|nr:hypothetical protein [Defluviicoccus sp.]
MTQAGIGPRLARAADILARDMMCIADGESVLVTADSGTDPLAVQAVQDAAYRLGAKVAAIVLAPPVPFQGGLADEYLPDHVKAAAGACDAWIDLCMPYLAGSGAFDDAMEKGRVRYFLGADMGAEGIVRLMGGADLDAMFALGDAFGDLIANAAGKDCRIANADGTEIRFTLGKPEGFALGRATAPGGYFVPGTVMIYPELESVKGSVVTRNMFHEYYTELAEPMTLEIDGKVTDVIGGGPENKVMRRALARAGNGEFGYVVHFTCGFHPAARYTGRCFIEDQRVAGYNAIGLGLPFWVPGGGENHPDCVISMQSLWIEGERILRDGAIVAPPKLAKMAEELRPVYL